MRGEGGLGKGQGLDLGWRGLSRLPNHTLLRGRVCAHVHTHTHTHIHSQGGAGRFWAPAHPGKAECELAPGARIFSGSRGSSGLGVNQSRQAGGWLPCSVRASLFEPRLCRLFPGCPTPHWAHMEPWGHLTVFQVCGSVEPCPSFP